MPKSFQDYITGLDKDNGAKSVYISDQRLESGCSVLSAETTSKKVLEPLLGDTQRLLRKKNQVTLLYNLYLSYLIINLEENETVNVSFLLMQLQIINDFYLKLIKANPIITADTKLDLPFSNESETKINPPTTELITSTLDGISIMSSHEAVVKNRLKWLGGLLAGGIICVGLGATAMILGTAGIGLFAPIIAIGIAVILLACSQLRNITNADLLSAHTNQFNRQLATKLQKNDQVDYGLDNASRKTLGMVLPGYMNDMHYHSQNQNPKKLSEYNLSRDDLLNLSGKLSSYR